MRILCIDLPATIRQDQCTLLHPGAQYTENVVTLMPSLLLYQPQEAFHNVCQSLKEYGHWRPAHLGPRLVE